MNQEEEKIRQAIALLDAQRSILGDDVVNTSLFGLSQYLRGLESSTKEEKPKQRMSLDGERRLVTVMFADFSNFTAMAERVDSEELRAVMNAAFSELVPIIEGYGGYVDKFIGDEIMALFGAPISHENDAECALRAALEMMQKLDDFNTRNNHALGLHFGINTGMVIAGGVGSVERQQYSVIGEAVNLAARLEDASVSGEILVGHETYKHVETIFEFEHRPPISAKGVSQPVPIYKLTGLKAVRQSRRGIRGLYSPMIGREEALRTLTAGVERLGKSKQAIAVLAEPGLGKSRLVGEFQKLTSNVKWTTARGQSFARNSSYSMIRSMINGILNIDQDEPIAEVTRILQESLVRWSPANVADLYPYLARLRGIPLDKNTDTFLLAMATGALQARMASAFHTLLQLYANHQPMIVFWEDAHWADGSSLELMGHLLKVEGPNNILHLLAFRTQEGDVQSYHQSWKGQIAEYTEVKLNSLSEPQCYTLIDNLLQIDHLPEKAKQVLAQKSDGNPFFLEELLRSLLETGVFAWEGDRIKVQGEITDLEVPDTLHGVIDARIDRLRAEDKQTLQNASIIGRVFGRQVLQYLLEKADKQIPLDATLPSLEDKEMILPRLPLEFIFKHAVTQDVAYHSLLKSQRKALHQFAGEIIEKLHHHNTAEVSAILAHHFKHAQNHPKAFHYQKYTADNSRTTFSYKEAKFYYNEALQEASLMPGNAEGLLAETRERLGEVLVSLSRFDEGRQAFQEAGKTLPDTDVVGKARLTRKVGESFSLQRNPAEELKSFDAALNILDAATDKSSLSWITEWLDIQLARVWSLYWLNRVDDMDVVLNEIEHICMRSGTPRQQSIWYGRRTIFMLRKQRYRMKPSQVHFPETALQLIHKAVDPIVMCHQTTLLGMVHLYSGNLEKAVEALGESHALAKRIANVEHQVVSLQFLNFAYMRLGDIANVRKCSRLMEEIVKDKMPFYLSSVLGFYAWCAWKEGRDEEAEQQGLEALKMINKAPVPNMHTKMMLVDIYARGNHIDKALEQLKDTLLPFQEKLHEEIESAIAAILNSPVSNEMADAQMRSALLAIVQAVKSHHYL